MLETFVGACARSPEGAGKEGPQGWRCFQWGRAEVGGMRSPALGMSSLKQLSRAASTVLLSR